jgi:pimeloyl-ACP methyl ester carboxylesterase
MATIRMSDYLKTFHTRNRSILQYYYHQISNTKGVTPTICFIPGFRSLAFQSTKPQYLHQFCNTESYSFLTWDHASQGVSVAADQDKVSVDLWFQDALDILSAKVDGPIVLIGSSMGAWISLLVATRGPTAIREKIIGIVGIGAGVNFTERWLNDEVPLRDPNYIWRRPTQYDDSGYYEIPVAMLLNSRSCLLPDKQLSVPCPTVFVHGRQDMDSKLENIIDLAKRIPGSSVNIIENGDHRLSKASDLEHIKLIINQVIKRSSSRTYKSPT